MSSTVSEILGWYGSDHPGTLTNLARLLNAGALGGTGKLVILPVDQGFEHGPARSFATNPAAYDPRYHFELAIEAGCNAYAAPLGVQKIVRAIATDADAIGAGGLRAAEQGAMALDRLTANYWKVAPKNEAAGAALDKVFATIEDPKKYDAKAFADSVKDFQSKFK